jgi:hypothetical protein
LKVFIIFYYFRKNENNKNYKSILIVPPKNMKKNNTNSDISKKSKKIVIELSSESSSESEDTEKSISSENEDVRFLPTLYATDSKGKERVWQCSVSGNVIYRKYGLVGGKLIESERSFEGKSIGKKNETSPEEQAWAEANKEWVKHLDKEYLPADDYEEGQKLLKGVNKEKKKTGGSNTNSVASAGGRAMKNISRKKTDTCMVDNIEGGPIIPMKAEVWELADDTDPLSVLPKVAKYFTISSGRGKNMVLEDTDFYVQPKIDGWRCRVMMQPASSENGGDGNFEIVMTSNSGKQYPWFTSLRGLFIVWLTSKKINKADLLDGLDGELYADKFVNDDGVFLDPLTRFSTVCSICGLSRSEPHLLEDQIQFHCFDMIDASGTLTQTERFKCRDNLFKLLPTGCKTRIISVETKILSELCLIPEVHNSYVALDYEGIMIRSFGMKYKCGKRTPEMRKVKYFKDEEYKIHGVKLDKGVSPEHFVWILQTEDGKEFSAKPKGTASEKLYWYKHKNNYIGKFLTVKFQEYSEDNIPRFPIAQRFRSGKGID